MISLRLYPYKSSHMTETCHEQAYRCAGRENRRLGSKGWSRHAASSGVDVQEKTIAVAVALDRDLAGIVD
jgi:hypothetical protein